MNIEDFRSFCLSLSAVTEDLPFDDRVLTFKVGGKIFAFTNLEQFSSVNLKCDPERAIELREMYSAVRAGYHMSKKHWNTIEIDGSIDDQLIFEWTKNSYDLVAGGLTKKQRQESGL